MKLQAKLTIALSLLGFAIIAAAAMFTNLELEEFFHARILDELRTQARTLESTLRIVPAERIHSEKWYEELRTIAAVSGVRLTLITKSGLVIFESGRMSDELPEIDNHSSRPEVEQALTNGFGTAERRSMTLKAEMLYYALRLEPPLDQTGPYADVTILRVGLPLTQIHQSISDLRSKIFATSSIVLVLTIILAFVLSKQVVRPIARIAEVADRVRGGDLGRRIEVKSKDEIGQLARSFNSMIDKLNNDIAQLKKLERVRSEFLANVSHELRTPIFSMQSTLETLLNGAIDDPAVNRDFLGRTLSNTHRLDALLSDLIDISRIESGDMKMSFRFFDVKDFLEQIVTEQQTTASQNGINLMVSPVPPGNDVFGDKERLKQVLSNLIDNSIKYTDSGGTITVSYTSENGSGRISVEDTGCGIPAEHLDRVFERFYRVDKARSREVGGTGLGLAIVKHIVEAHGSKVDVLSEVGKGSTFSFVLKT